MALIVPNAINYPSPLTVTPSLMQDEPREGRQQIAAEIEWSSMGGTARAVSFNLQQNNTQAWTQIATLKCDNSQCAVDVRFLFTDTGETITIPAYTANAVLPVYSNARSFFVVGAGSLAGDVTRFVLLNYHQEPVVLPGSTGQEQAGIATSRILMSASSSTQIIPAGVNGTITGVCISAFCDGSTAAAYMSATLVSGAPVTFGLQVAFDLGANSPAFNGVLMQMSDLDIHFSNGVQFNQGPGNIIPDGLTPTFGVYVFYRTTA